MGGSRWPPGVLAAAAHQVLRGLAELGLLELGCATVSGRSLGEEIARLHREIEQLEVRERFPDGIQSS